MKKPLLVLDLEKLTYRDRVRLMAEGFDVPEPPIFQRTPPPLVTPPTPEEWKRARGFRG